MNPALALLFAASVAGQTPGTGRGGAPQDLLSGGTPGPTPTRIEFTSAVGCYPITPSDAKEAVRSVDDLVNEYNDGRLWLQLQEDLKAILSTCEFSAPLARITPDDFKSKTFLVTFVSNDRQPYYVVVPQRQPYSMTLLGVKAVNAIVLVDAKAKEDAVPTDFMFMSTPLQTPLEAKIPAPAKQAPASFVTNQRSVQPKNARPPASRKERDPAMYAYAAAGITLPFSRASIAEAGTLTVKDPVSGTSTDVKISTTYANTPKVRIEFTAVVGAVIGPFGGPQRMKVDAAKYASDPSSHALTMATVS